MGALKCNMNQVHVDIDKRIISEVAKRCKLSGLLTP